jgi:hypothetical protein
MNGTEMTRERRRIARRIRQTVALRRLARAERAARDGAAAEAPAPTPPTDV